MKTFFLALLLIVNSSLIAAITYTPQLSDSVQVKLDKVKHLLLNSEWEARDAEQLNRLKELLQYIEKKPIDSIVVELKYDLDTTKLFIQRDIRNVYEVEKIEGYTRAWEINNSIINIEKHAKEEMPFESIIVPEDQYVDMYSKLPLITFGNMNKLIEDSLVILPDTLKLLIANAKLEHSVKKQKQADSIVASFLDLQRKTFNNKLINEYKDSVSNAYKANFQKRYIDSLITNYTNSVAANNIRLIEAFNDSITILKNRELAEDISTLIHYVDTLPNKLTVLNKRNEAYDLNLQNDEVWFKWLWLKNSQNDSIGIRVENLGKNKVRMLIDESVTWNKMTQFETNDVLRKLAPVRVDRSLHKVKTRNPELSPWKLVGNIYSGFTQTYINDYWSKGGKSSASVLNTFRYDANYSKNKVKFENGVDAKLGLIYYIPEEGSQVYRNWHKNTDNLELNSRFGYSAFKEWYYSAEANFKTQFFLGYRNNNDSIPNSAIFAPAYLTFSVGFDYKPSKEFSTFLSPISVKTTYVSNPNVDETRFGLQEGETRKTRFGMAGKFELSKKLMDNISIRSKNSIFVNYGNNNEGEWQLTKIPDFDSEISIDMKINQFISTQINFHLIYDKDVVSKWTDDDGVEQTGTKLQVKEFITFGISYKL